MNTNTPPSADDHAIRQIMQRYLSGAISGRSDDLKDVFHSDAVIHGYIGPELFGGPIRMFYDWHDENGPAADLTMTITSIDIQGAIATARIELENWTGHRFTDMFTLLRTDGHWRIISKVFHLHP